MRVIGYIRVSTEEQALQGHSLGAQEAKLRAYAELYDLELVEVVADAAQSARTLKRPGLQRALAMLDGGQTEGLLVAKLDRLTRSLGDWIFLVERYFSARFQIMSVGEQCDTRTATGRMMLNLLLTIAQWERETIGERTKAALQHLKSQGVKLGAPGKPYQDSRAIARMRALRAEGLPLRAICAHLDQEGYPTQKGGAWQPTSVRNILAREAC